MERIDTRARGEATPRTAWGRPAVPGGRGDGRVIGASGSGDPRSSIQSQQAREAARRQGILETLHSIRTIF